MSTQTSHLIAGAGIVLVVASASALAADPTVTWGAYLGGVNYETATDVAVDAEGNIYVVGATDSAGWVSGGFDATYSGTQEDAFVAKVSPAGGLLWATYLGGELQDLATDVAVDAGGNVYVSGSTMSPGWVSGGFDTNFDQTRAQTEDAFVAKLSPQGAHLWSTYLGGAGRDTGEGVAVDSEGNVYLSGTTATLDWLAGGYDASYNGGVSDAFVVKLTSTGQHLWSSYLGGALEESGAHVAVGSDGSVYVEGQTMSPGWAAYGFNTIHGGDFDIFVVKLSRDGDHLWSTYLGGAAADYATGMTTDGLGGIYAVGLTSSPGWTRGGANTQLNAAPDGFVAKLDSSGRHLWSTYVGGGDSDVVSDAICDDAGNVYVTGNITVAAGATPSNWVSGGFSNTYNGGEHDGLVAALSGTGRLLWSSFLGGDDNEHGTGIAVDSDGHLYVVGETASAGWLRGGFDQTCDGPLDAFVMRIADNPEPIPEYCPVYQFWSPSVGRRFYTISESERQYLIDNFPDVWIYEGVAWNVPWEGADANSMPVYRFWSKWYDDHFYTISEEERDVLIRDYDYFWLLEGPAFYAYPESSHPSGTVPVYRFWSAADSTHVYTIDEGEKDDLIRNASDVWTFEGVAFYVYPP